MLRWALLAVAAAALVAIGIVLVLPVASGPRPEPRILAGGDASAAPPGGFVIHDAPAAAAAPPPTPMPPQPAPADLDAVMSRLRAASAKPDAALAAPPAPVTPAPVPAVVPPAPADTPPPGPHWGSVTGQGTRWRMVKTAGGYTLSIDLGGGQTADVHVLPAFGTLDPAAVNVRVDYLRDTIVQDFSSRGASYTFARDGSVSIDR